MKRLVPFAAFLFSIALMTACGDKPKAEPAVMDLNTLVAAVPNEGPREGNNYKAYLRVLRQNQAPAVGFPVEAWVEGMSKPETVLTDAAGIAKFEALPYPDAKNQLNAVFHYYLGDEDGAREIAYPFLQTDAYRMKDTQYIPNNATPQPQ